MVITLAALLGHPHPFVRGLIGLLFLAVLFVLVAAVVYARYRRHNELTSRLNNIEDKLNRFASPPPAPPATK